MKKTSAIHKSQANIKLNLHEKNAHRFPYDFPQLIQAYPELENYIRENEYGNLGIDFSNPLAVKALNKALLVSFYGIHNWDIPNGYLCPPIPGRADYIHHLATYLNYKKSLKGIDIGTGANCIYPLLGYCIYQWSFTASDIDSNAITNAKKIIADNPKLNDVIDLRIQSNTNSFFKGIIQTGETYDFSMCNPPFHASAAEAKEKGLKKINNLKGKKPTEIVLNFGGQSNELWYSGGERKFIAEMIKESKLFAKQVKCFSSLVSKSENLDYLCRLLKQLNCKSYKVIDMAQGNKKSRILIWHF